MLEGDPDLAGVVLFERRRWAAPIHWGEMWRSVRWLRQQGFDWVIDLQCLMRSGVFAWLANGKLSIGLDEPREGARGFYDHIVRRPSRPHARRGLVSERAAGPGRAGGRRFPMAAAPPRRGRIGAAPMAGGRARWIALQPGARWLNKRWPVESYAELVRLLAPANPGFHFAILGDAEDRPLGEAIARADPARCLDLTGRLSCRKWSSGCGAAS